MYWSELAIIKGLILFISFSASKVVQAAPSVNLFISIILQFGLRILRTLDILNFSW